MLWLFEDRLWEFSRDGLLGVGFPLASGDWAYIWLGIEVFIGEFIIPG